MGVYCLQPGGVHCTSISYGETESVIDEFSIMVGGSVREHIYKSMLDAGIMQGVNTENGEFPIEFFDELRKLYN